MVSYNSCMGVGEKCLTLVPSLAEPPSRSHTHFVVPQCKLTYVERGILGSSETLSLTGHIQIHDAPRPLRSRASRTWDMGRHRESGESLPARALGHKIGQAFPVRPGFPGVKLAVVGSVSLTKETSTLTLRTEYPAPRGLISHFQLSDILVKDSRNGRTRPLPSSRAVDGRQHVSLECSWISMYVWPKRFWIL